MGFDLLLVCLVGGIVAIDTTSAWQVMICRPIVSGPLVGLLFGDLQTGLLIGALMELIWSGIVPTGASVFPDSNVASVVAAAVAIELNRDFSTPHFVLLTSIAYSVPVAYIGSLLIIWMRRKNTALLSRALRFADEGNSQKVIFMNWLGVIHSFARGFLFSGLMFVGGTVVLSKVLSFSSRMGSRVPEQGLIPMLALGGAVALFNFGSKRTFPYVFAGLIVGLFVSLF